MRKLFLIVFTISLLLVSCNNSEKEENIVEKYIDAFNQKNKSALKNILSDDIEIIDFKDDKIVGNQEEYFNQYFVEKELFGEKKDILQIEGTEAEYNLIEADSNLFDYFAFGGKRKNKITYTITDGKISKIEQDTLQGFQQQALQAALRISELGEFIYVNYPDEDVNTVIFDSKLENKKKLREYLVEYLRL